MDKLGLYRQALDSAVFIRLFMFNENHYSRVLDDALQPFIDGVIASVCEMLPKSKELE